MTGADPAAQAAGAPRPHRDDGSADGASVRGAVGRGGGETPRDDDGVTVVDARGLRCPLPVIRLAEAAAGLPAGARVAVLATDPAARVDVPAWTRMRGHTTLGERVAPDHVRIDVVLG